MAMVEYNALGLQLGKVPMLKPLVVFMIGIIFGCCGRLSMFLFWPVVIVISALAYTVSLRYRITVRGRLLALVAFYGFWSILGIWLAARTSPVHQSVHFSNLPADALLVVVGDDPEIKDETIRFSASVIKTVYGREAISSRGKIMLTIRKDGSVPENFVNYGDLLHIPNLVQGIKPPSNPGEFNYKAYLENKDIWQQCYVSAAQVKKIDVGKGNPIVAYALSFRKQMICKFSANIPDYNSLQLATALIFGYRSQIDEDIVSVFRNTGTVHILSVSGLHVGLMFLFLSMLLKWMDRLVFGRYIRGVVMLIAIWFYVILTGMSPPILRAGIMITFFIVSHVINRKQVTLNTLFASALFILLFSPKDLFDIGFQLSYLAVLGILLLKPLFKSLYSPKSSWKSLIIEYSYISIAAQLFTLPAILYYFGQFPTYFIPANLFIALPSTVIMYLGVLLTICPFDPVNYYLGMALDFLLRFVVEGLEFLERLPEAVITGDIWHELQVVLAFGALVAAIWAWNFKAKKALFVGVILGVIFLVFTNVRYFITLHYSGGRIYNVRSEIAISHIKKGKVILCATFDSLTHKNNRFLVLPDLKRFSTMDEIEYVKLPSSNNQNYVLSLGDKKILILENELVNVPSEVDIVIWRKNNKNLLNSIQHKIKGNPIYLFDGSNSEKTILNLRNTGDILNNQMYILKNNFAYVWDEK